MIQLYDNFGRTFKTLRVSLLNSCNLACSYCVNPDVKSTAENPLKKNKRLGNEQFIACISALHHTLSLDTIRLTGGEPLLYKPLLPLIEGIRNIGLKKIKITTNGVLLAEKAKALKQSGITSINVSLDSIDEKTSLAISKKNNLQQILKGIDCAVNEGISLKVNSVILKGMNDNDIMPLFEFCKQRNIVIRFLELMEMGHLYHNYQEYFFSEDSILDVIQKQYKITSLPRAQAATANYWTTSDGYQFGIIANSSSPFCEDCNRLRLDSYGNIFGCLSNDTPIPITAYLEQPQLLEQKLMEALKQKQTKFSGSKLSMLHIGG